MADGFVKVQPDSTGKAVDTSELTRPDGTVVERQRMVIASDADARGVAPVDATAGLFVNITNATINTTIGNDQTAPIPVSGQVAASIIGARGTPVDVGQTVMANSLPVAIASDQPAIGVNIVSTPIPVSSPSPLNVNVQSVPTTAVTAADGAVATLGATQDATVYGDLPGSHSAQLRGINAQLQINNAYQRQIVQMLDAILAQLNQMGLQAGVAPTISPLTLQ